MAKSESIFILLVEDDPDDVFVTRKAIHSALQDRLTAEISVAHDGAQAINMLRRHALQNSIPDLILLDLNMPTMDGHAFLRAFREEHLPRRPRVVVFTTSFDIALHDKALGEGADEAWAKPPTLSELQSVLKKILTPLIPQSHPT